MDEIQAIAKEGSRKHWKSWVRIWNGISHLDQFNLKKKERVYYTVTDQMEEKIFSKQSNESSCVVNI